MKASQIEIGKDYNLNGYIYNGYKDGLPYLCLENVTRKVTGLRDNKIFCECGRVFVADTTKISKVRYENYSE